MKALLFSIGPFVYITKDMQLYLKIKLLNTDLKTAPAKTAIVAPVNLVAHSCVNSVKGGFYICLLFL